MQPQQCPQPFCPLQRDGLDSSKLAEFLVRLLSGAPVSQLRPGPPLESLATCSACVKQIEEGRGPLPWGVEAEQMVAGWRSYRRARRQRQ